MTPILNIFKVDAYSIGSTGAVPFGYFFLLFMAGVVFIRACKFQVVTKSEIYEIFFYLIWVVFLLFYVSVARAVSLSSAFFILIFLKIGLKSGISFKGMALGYLCSLFLMFVIKIYDTNLCGFFVCFTDYSRSFLGYEIYQYYVSYAAVMALICCVGVLSLSFAKISVIPVLLSLCLLSYGEVALTYRKAPVVELVFTLILLLSIFVSAIFYQALKKSLRVTGPILLCCILVIGLSLNVSNKRSLLGVEAITDRTSTYLIALEVISGENFEKENSNATKKDLLASSEIGVHHEVSNKLVKFLFGYQAGWGGYGNTFIEFFIRTGACGLTLFVISLFFMFKNIINLYGFNLGPAVKFHHIGGGLLAAVFIFSMTLGNVVNLNIQLPYYYANWVVLLFTTFVFLIRKNNST